MGKSRILIIGVTGKLGYHLALASLDFSHPTFALVRDSAFSDPRKSHKLHSLSTAGATLLKVSLSLTLTHTHIMSFRHFCLLGFFFKVIYICVCVHFLEWQGSLQDEASLVEALKQVDVVICAVSSNQVLDQKLLIPAIKQAGCIKVFISSFLLGFFFFK
jgi:putative NADH-flavin reductase